MADDVASLPSTGIIPVICGTRTLATSASTPLLRARLVIDLNDFDEAHPGAWEWDLRRLVASIWVAGRENSATEEACAAAVMSCVAAYRDEVAFLRRAAAAHAVYNRLDVDRLHETATRRRSRGDQRSAKRAAQRTSDRALPRFTRSTRAAAASSTSRP
jgi:uncharacterized protein (DUF2252 family)